MSAPDKNGWRLIATAPQDGTRILICDRAVSLDGYISIGWYVDRISRGTHWRQSSGVARPTHWQSLPDLPEAK
jgi:hypothetical protein